MINLLVSEAYALDYLSILQIKAKRKVVALSDVTPILMQLFTEIGKDKLIDIMSSRIYLDLYKVNEELFDAMNGAPKDEVKASEIHRLNTARFNAKKALQDKFFDTEYGEKKSGN